MLNQLRLTIGLFLIRIGLWITPDTLVQWVETSHEWSKAEGIITEVYITYPGDRRLRHP